MKTYAQTVIIGAGIVGCSTAYYLAQYGVKDVLVIDKGELFQNDGSTAHAPGGVNPLSNSTAMAQFATASIDLYDSLPLWKPGRKPLYMVGGVDVARTEDRMDEVRRLYSNGKGFGVEAHIIDPREISDLFPLINGNLFKGALYTPRKPVVAGPHVSGSLAREAEKMAGHRFVGYTKATDFVVENGRLSGILTNNPDLPHIQCERLLLCTNIWTPALSEKLGITIPLLAAEHQYLKSEPLPQLAHVSDRSSGDHEVIYPSVRDLDGGLYYRHWWDSMGIGSYHHRPIMVRPATLGESADHPFTPDDFAEAQKMAEETIPALKGVSFPYRINGMFSFSVDGMPILGETPLKGCWVATAVWLSHAGGVGKAMAQWMTYGEPDVDMRQVDLNRFLPYQKTDRFIQTACAKSYAEVHDVVHPAQWSSKPRNVRLTPFHRRHEEMRAVFQPNAGLEMPYWLEENQRLLEKYDDQIPQRTGWSAQYWSRIQGAEHLAMRESAGLFDLTNLAIIEVEGDDACAFANYLCTSQMDIPVGRVAYTLLCTPKGGIKRDITAARLAANRYWFFTGNVTLPLELAWFHRYAAGYNVTIRDLSHSYAALGLFGPNARRILQKVTPNNVANDAFPFYSWQTLEIGMATAYAMRISYVGELGWEFHLPMDTALAVRDELWEAGREFNLVSCGVGAMRSMRVEKGYRLWGADIYTEHNPYEAGMGWMVKLNKGDFVGREALQAIKSQPLTRRLVTLTLDDHNVLLTGNEPVWGNGRLIGQITSGNYGYNIGSYIAFAYLPPDYTQPGTQLEVEYLAQRYPATVTADALFDAANERMRG
ncbi:MAG: FAD-dependent oxidoreductase [Ardenticatenaceae bacterium]|nr:FAD-dependent oxidoreductase [Ardenticatenaceae bacterium]